MLARILWIDSGYWWSDLFVAIVGGIGTIGSGYYFFQFYREWIWPQWKIAWEENKRRLNERHHGEK